MKKGRPTKYTDEINTKAQEYLKQCQDQEYEFHKTRGDRSDTYEEKVRVSLPTIEGLALYLGVNRDSLYEWKGKHKEFSDTLHDILAEQSKRLQEGALSGRYNPLIAKLILSANHGMKEKSDITSDDKPIQGNTIVFTDFSEDEE